MWKTVKLGEICDLMTGGTPSRQKPEYFDGGEIRWLVSGDIHQREIFDCERRITQAGYENSSAKYLPENSVLIALNGQGKTRGTVALLRAKATCNQSLVSIYPKKGVELDNRLLFHILDRKYQQIRKMTGSSGNDRRGLNMPLIRSIEICIPTGLEKQQRIVETLDRVGNIKRLRQQAIETTQRIAPALFYEMFGNPVRNEKGWDGKEIGEICEQDRIAYDSERDGQLTYLALEHIDSNTGNILNLSDGVEGGQAATFVFNETHVLYGKLRPYLNKVVVPTFRGRCTEELIPYLPKPNIGRCYLAYLLRSEPIVNSIVSKTTGARMPRANLDYLESIKVGVPPYEMHQVFEDRVASMKELLRRQSMVQERNNELSSALSAQLLAA